MSKREGYEKQTQGILEPILAENNFELVDVEYLKEAGEFYLRVYIDKPGGINIQDCTLVSRALSEKLDEKDFIEDGYILEVSSPGLLRPLKKDKDFDRNIGKEVEVNLYKPIDKEKHYRGILKSYNKEKIVLEIESLEKEFSREDVALIRPAFDF